MTQASRIIYIQLKTIQNYQLYTHYKVFDIHIMTQIVLCGVENS